MQSKTIETQLAVYIYKEVANLFLCTSRQLNIKAFINLYLKDSGFNEKYSIETK